jgi:serine protease
MFTPWQAVYRCILSFLFVAWPLCYSVAQQLPVSTGIGTATRPHTVVYKLKQQPSGQLRQATGSNRLQLALTRVGATSVAQKFPQTSPLPLGRQPKVDLSLIYELTYDATHSLEAVQQALLATGMVEYVEPLYQRVPLYQPNDPASDSTKTTQAYLKNIQAYGAWAVQKGDTNIVIGVLDSGFRFTHEDIKKKIKFNYDDPIDGIDNDGDGLVDNFYGWDFADWDNNLVDDSPYRGHGTKVAGAAIADADNGVGMAGSGFNTKFMPIKVFPSTSYGRFGGYEAIVYAADKGCSIINLSWGGMGFSNFEQDIINYAVLEKDVVVVAAAGNTNAFVNIYPAAYDNVLAVGGTHNDVKTNGHTWNHKISLTAPSQSVYSTTQSRDNSYGNDTGTSLASPLVAGAAALLRSHLPHLNALQVVQRLRATADDIYHLPENAAYFELLGRGRLNMKRALLQKAAKSVRCTSFAIGDGFVPQIGDTMQVYIHLTNYLDPLNSLQVSVTSTSPFIEMISGNLEIGSMASLGHADNKGKPITFRVLPDAPANAMATFRLGFSDVAYTDFQYFQLPVNPDYLTLTQNNLHITLNSKGNLGYNGYNFRQGIGITYKDSPSLLFEGGLLVATAPDRVSDNVRNASWQTDNDFVSQQAVRLRHKTKDADQEISGIMRDRFPAPAQAGVQVSYKGMAWANDPNRDFVILEYRMQNITDDTLQTTHAGLFADWNIVDAYLNVADWDEDLNMGYVYNTGTTAPYAGIKLLTQDPPSYYAIDNLSGGSSTFSIADGFSTQEKYRALSGGVARTKAWGSGFGNDVSHVVGTTLEKLAPGSSRTVAFAIVAGDNLEHLRSNAAAAQLQYHRIRSGPMPQALTDTVCIGTTVTINPIGGNRFKFFADEAKTTLLGMGARYELAALQEQTTLFVCNADSAFDSPVVPFRFSVAKHPVAGFRVLQGQEERQAGKRINFKNESENGNSWLWQFGNGDTSTEENPVYTYNTPGTYQVLLTVQSAYGCTEAVVEQQLEITQIVEEVPSNQDPVPFKFAPNPASDELRITVPLASTPLTVSMTDAMGRRVSPRLVSRIGHESVFDLSRLAEGLYIVQLTFDDQTHVKRLLILRH